MRRVGEAADGGRSMEQTAGGVVLNRLGELLLVNQCGTSWSFPKGHIEAGESPIGAARREIFEETGVDDLEAAGELATYERSSITAAGELDEARPKRVTLYLFRSSHAVPRPRDPQNPEARWVPRDIAELLLTHPRDRAELRRLRELLPPVPGSTEEERLTRCLRSIAPDCPEEIVRRFIASTHLETKQLAAEAHLTLDKPYGVNHILVADGSAGLSFARLLPGRSTSVHYHTRRSELFLVRTGTLALGMGHERLSLDAGEIGISIPGRPHSIANAGEEPLEIIELFVPALLADKVRLSDPYARPLGPVGIGE